jgi:hypothetical protein
MTSSLPTNATQVRAVKPFCDGSRRCCEGTGGSEQCGWARRRWSKDAEAGVACFCGDARNGVKRVKGSPG